MSAVAVAAHAEAQAQVVQLRQQLVSSEQQVGKLAAQLAVANRQLAAAAQGQQREELLQQAARDAMERLAALEVHAQQVGAWALNV